MIQWSLTSTFSWQTGPKNDIFCCSFQFRSFLDGCHAKHSGGRQRWESPPSTATQARGYNGGQKHRRRERERCVAPHACLSASECRRPLQWNADFFLRTSCSSTTMLPLLPPSQLNYENGYSQPESKSFKENPSKVDCWQSLWRVK